jgi:hypothetical protein
MPVTKELLDDIDVRTREDADVMLRELVTIRLVKTLWGFITDRQPDREGMEIMPLSRWEHLKRALLPKRFATWHPLDNGQPIFERIYLTLGDKEPYRPERSDDLRTRAAQTDDEGRPFQL